MRKLLLWLLLISLSVILTVSCDLDLFGNDDNSTVVPTLKSIEVLYPPTQLNYKEHSVFKKSGLVIVGLYSDNTKKVITDYDLTIKDGDDVGIVSGTDLTTTKTNIVTYESKTTSFDIYVEKSGTLNSIKITSLPTHLIYNENLLFEESGLKVVGVYTDGSEMEISGYTLSIPNGTTVGTVSGTDLLTTKTNTVSFNDKETSFEICVVKYLTLNSIEVKTSPTKTTYYENEEFDDSGLVVVSVYSDGSRKLITDYELSVPNGTTVGTVNGNDLLTTKTNTVKYEGKETSFDFYVERILERIEVKTLPTKTHYTENSIFEINGLKILGVYSNSLEKEVTDYTLSIPNGYTVGTVSGTDLLTTKTNIVSYKEKTTSFDIYVEKSGSLGTLESIEVLSLPTKINYTENSLFDDSGLVVVGVYSDSSKRVITDYTLSLKNGESVGTVDSGDKKTIINTVTYNGDSSITTSFEITVKKVPFYTMKKGTEWFSTSTDLRSNITKIVFDYTDNLPQHIKNKINTQISFGNTDNDLIYLIEDGTELYIFSYGIICGNSDCREMFENFNNSNLKEITFNNFNTTNVTHMNNMFKSCWTLETLDVSNWNTFNVTDMSHMFERCWKLETLDVSKWETSKVKDMSFMFDGCYNLTSLNLSKFDTSNVTNMTFMFYECKKLTSLDLSNFKTSNVNNMCGMFNQCLELTSITFGEGFNTSNVTNMGNMFDYCSQLTSLDLSGFNTSNVSSMNSMFNGCSQLTSLNLSGFNTSKVTNMGYMFYNCSSLTSLDLSSFNTSKVTSKDYMFYNCGKSETTVTINPTYESESFFNGTELGNTDDWTYSSPTFTHK